MSNIWIKSTNIEEFYSSESLIRSYRGPLTLRDPRRTWEMREMCVLTSWIQTTGFYIRVHPAMPVKMCQRSVAASWQKRPCHELKYSMQWCWQVKRLEYCSKSHEVKSALPICHCWAREQGPEPSTAQLCKWDKHKSLWIRASATCCKCKCEAEPLHH